MRFLVLILALAVPHAAFAGHGTVLFNQAYKAEESDPEGSIPMYRAALNAGLSADLARAAHWRLFFIFKDQESYGLALREADYLPANARSQIVASIRERYAVKQEIVDRYMVALREVSSSDTSRKKSGAHNLTQIYESSPPSLRRRILLDLSENEAEETALTLIQKEGEDTEGLLREADLLVFMGRNAEAEKLIQKIYIQDDLSSEQKTRIVYLLGRARRDSGRDIELFRTAEQYAEGDERLRMRALAAYGLLRQGYPEQARALMRGVPIVRDADIELLDLLLRAEIDDDKKAMKSLVARRSTLKEIVRKKRDSYLASRALKLIGGRD
ncbi:MAG: hypothetical protein K8S54_14855 [Spirochaetia bacterium]|nr:hypothetical protein [Spirochaetia bacterium]